MHEWHSNCMPWKSVRCLDLICLVFCMCHFYEYTIRWWFNHRKRDHLICTHFGRMNHNILLAFDKFRRSLPVNLYAESKWQKCRLEQRTPEITTSIKLKFGFRLVSSRLELNGKKKKREIKRKLSSLAEWNELWSRERKSEKKNACVYGFSQLAKNLLAIYLNSILCKYQITKW